MMLIFCERVMALYKENGTTPNANDKAVYGLKQITAKYQHHKEMPALTIEITGIPAPIVSCASNSFFCMKPQNGAYSLYKENGTTPNANDKAVYGLKQITAKYQHHKDQLEYTRLYAPFCGFIQKKAIEPVPPDIVGCRKIDFHLRNAGADHRDHGHTCSDRFMCIEHGYHCTFDLYPGENYPLKLISVTPKANANQLYTIRFTILLQKCPARNGNRLRIALIAIDRDHRIHSRRF